LDGTSLFFELSHRAISPRLKLFLWFIAWGFVALFTAAAHPSDLLGAFAFPLGLCGAVPSKVGLGIAFGFAQIVTAVGWLIYLLLSLAIKNAKNFGRFSFLYFVLCVLLVLNMVGCRRLIATAAKIE
jgi:hypothetical protein